MGILRRIGSFLAPVVRRVGEFGAHVASKIGSFAHHANSLALVANAATGGHLEHAIRAMPHGPQALALGGAVLRGANTVNNLANSAAAVARGFDTRYGSKRG